MIIGQMAVLLHGNKVTSKVLQSNGKPTQQRAILTDTFGRGVVQGAINLDPSMFASALFDWANPSVRSHSRYCVKQRIINRATRATQICSARPCFGFGERFGNSDKVNGLQLLSSALSPR